MRSHARRWIAAAAIVVSSAPDALATSRVACLDVAAGLEWQSTGVDLQAGDAVCVLAHAARSRGREAGDIEPYQRAAGYISQQNAPQRTEPVPYARVGPLLGKIGNAGPAFPLEDGLCFLVRSTPADTTGLPGELLLGINDTTAHFGDTAGPARVAIAVDHGASLVVQPTPDRSAFHRLERQAARGNCLR